MIKAKKIVSLLTATAILATVAMTGCSKKPGDSSSDAGDKGKYDFSGNAKITIFQSKVEIVDQLEELAEKYKKETGAEIEIWGASGDGYVSQLKSKLTSNQGPTIFTTNPGSEAQQFKSYLYDMSKAAFVKNVAPNLELKLDDKVVGVPFGIEGYGFIYNKDLVKPEDISTLDGFTKVLKDMKDKGLNGFSLSQEAYFLIAHMLNIPFALQKDPVDFVNKVTAGEVKMSETKEFQEWVKYMEAIRANAINPLEVNYDKQVGDFAMGQNAMINQGNWAYNMFVDYKDDIDFEYGMMPFPMMENDKLAVGVPIYWAINSQKSEAETKAAVDFLDWLHNSETGKDYIVNKFNFLPAMTNIEAKKDIDPLSKAVLEASNSGKSLTWTFNFWPAGIVENDLAPATQAFFSDKNMSGAQYLKNLDAAWANAVK